MRIFRNAVVPTAVTTAMLVGSGTALAQDAAGGTGATATAGLNLSGLLDSILGLVTGLLGGLGI